MKKTYLILLSILLISCQENKQDLVKYVNPFIGTGGHGHTYPGVSAPFGMVQLSPDTRLEGWDGCGGYHFSDSIIYGFSHTHLSGTGISDYADVLLMPTTGKIQLTNGVDEAKINNAQINDLGYASKFSHKNEIAQAGYYQVLLDDYNINVELTSSIRTGMHRYTYPKNEDANVILDLKHRDKLLDYKINIIDSQTITGFRHSTEWARDQRIYFTLKFSIPFLNPTTSEAELNSDYEGFNNEKNVLALAFGKISEPLEIKASISAVDIEGAIGNLSEISDWDFDKVKTEAQNAWENELKKIEITTNSKSKKEILISTYICHPSMGNNEISGPVVSTALAQWISALDDPYYTYRFIFIPETIGSIVYLSQHMEHLKSNVIAGFNITCVGDDRCYSFLPSRNGSTLADRVGKHVLSHIDSDYKQYTWLDRGSDERQYCSPGFNLDVGVLTRSMLLCNF